MLLKIQNALKSHVTTICFTLTYKKLSQFTENHLSIQVKDITPKIKMALCWMAERKGDHIIYNEMGNTSKNRYH